VSNFVKWENKHNIFIPNSSHLIILFDWKHSIKHRHANQIYRSIVYDNISHISFHYNCSLCN